MMTYNTLLKYVINALLVTVVIRAQHDPASDQLVSYKQKLSGPIGTLTTTSGRLIDFDEASNTLNKELLRNEYFIEHFNHAVSENIPARFVHAKGTGAIGYFELTQDVTDICKADFLNMVGKKNRIAVRFSPNGSGLQGEADTVRAIKSMAVKFYTEEGNFDLLTLNTPTLVLNEANFFFSFLKSNKKNPATNMYDQNMVWDFATLRPESLDTLTYLFSDSGLPASYAEAAFYAIHTYQVVNNKGESHFVRFHFIPDKGIKNLCSQKGKEIACSDPDYYTRKLYDAIAAGDYPSWTLKIQVLSLDDVANAGFDVFDITLKLPLDKYPLREVGKLVLNENPLNHFSQIEQLAFNPGNLVDGILGAPDKMFESRRLAYRSAQYYRLGTNFENIEVNCPIHPAFTYNRDGAAQVLDSMNDEPTYYPNSFYGPEPYTNTNKVELIEIHQIPANTVNQTRNFYLYEIKENERARLIDNIVATLGLTASFVQDRVVDAFTSIVPDFGERIRAGLQKSNTAKAEN